MAEVASLGGFVKQYQVLLDPARLLAYGVTARQVIAVVRGANQDVGARTVEISGADYAIRGVVIPAGEHLVRFEYRPRSFYIGAAISVLSLGTLAWLIGFSFFRSSKSKRQIP